LDCLGTKRLTVSLSSSFRMEGMAQRALRPSAGERVELRYEVVCDGSNVFTVLMSVQRCASVAVGFEAEPTKKKADDQPRDSCLPSFRASSRQLNNSGGQTQGRRPATAFAQQSLYG
jgi:hypothetical protein